MCADVWGMEVPYVLLELPSDHVVKFKFEVRVGALLRGAFRSDLMGFRNDLIYAHPEASFTWDECKGWLGSDFYIRAEEVPTDFAHKLGRRMLHYIKEDE